MTARNAQSRLFWKKPRPEKSATAKSFVTEVEEAVRNQTDERGNGSAASACVNPLNGQKVTKSQG